MGARPPNRITPVPRIRNSGTASPLAVIDVRTVAGPATYSTGGIPVNLSASYTTLIAVYFTRAYTTATTVSVLNQIGMPNETGTDVYASGKFRLLLGNAPGHTHNYDKADTPTGTANSGLGGADPHSHTLTYTATASGAASATAFAEIAAGSTQPSGRTYEYVVIGIPV